MVWSSSCPRILWGISHLRELVPSLWVWARLSDSYLLMKKMWQKWGLKALRVRATEADAVSSWDAQLQNPISVLQGSQSSHVPRSAVQPSGTSTQGPSQQIASVLELQEWKAPSQDSARAQALSTSTDTVRHGNSVTKPAWIADSWKIKDCLCFKPQGFGSFVLQ